MVDSELKSWLSGLVDLKALRVAEMVGFVGTLSVAASIAYMWGYSISLGMGIALARYFSFADYAALAVAWLPPMLFACAVTIPLVRVGASILPPAKKVPVLFGIIILLAVGSLWLGFTIDRPWLLFMGCWVLAIGVAPVLIALGIRARRPGSERVFLLYWFGIFVVTVPISIGAMDALTTTEKSVTEIQLADGSMYEGKIHFVLSNYIIFGPAESDTLLAISRSLMARAIHTRRSVSDEGDDSSTTKAEQPNTAVVIDTAINSQRTEDGDSLP